MSTNQKGVMLRANQSERSITCIISIAVMNDEELSSSDQSHRGDSSHVTWSQVNKHQTPVPVLSNTLP